MEILCNERIESAQRKSAISKSPIAIAIGAVHVSAKFKPECSEMHFLNNKTVFTRNCTFVINVHGVFMVGITITKRVPEVISVASLISSYRTFKYVPRKNLKNFPDYAAVSLLISYPIYVPKIREIKSALRVHQDLLLV